MKLKIKKLRPDAIIPKYQTEGASGFDLHALDRVEICATDGVVKIATGLTVELPPGYELQIRPRSGLSSKTPLRVILGTVDQDYTGHLQVMCEVVGVQYIDSWKYNPNTGEEVGISELYPKAYLINPGDRIAQAVIVPVARADIEEVEELSETGRGSRGFGSTDS